MSRNGTIENTWFLIRFFNRVMSAWADGFANGVAEYPDDETGELLKRRMAQKSWFDEMTSWWVERSFFGKIAYIAGITFVAWLVGMIVGWPLLTFAAGLFVSFSVHNLFSSHEENRRAAANLSALEATSLAHDLDVIHDHLDHTVVNIQADADVLRTQGELMSAQMRVLNLEQQRLVDNDASLLVIVEEATKTSAELHEQGRAIAQSIGDISNHMTTYDATITKLTEKAACRSEELSSFSKTIHGIRESQTEYSAAVTRFSLFVNAQPLVKETITVEPHDDDILTQLKQENDENERMMREWSFSMQ